MTVLHATEPATVYLSLWARVPTSRSPTSTGRCTRTAPWSSSWRCAAPSSCSRATCCRPPGGAPRPGWPRRTARGWPRRSRPRGLADDGAAWLDAADARRPWPASRTAPSCPPRSCASRSRSSPGSSSSRRARRTAARPDRAAGAHPARRRGARSCAGATPATGGPAARCGPPMATWLGETPSRAEAREGYAELVRRWLRTSARAPSRPQWWLGATKAAVRRALADVGAVEVSLDGGADRLAAARRPRGGRPTPSRGRRCCRCSTRR